MFKTKFTELVNTEYPIMQGGMMWISRAELTSAVSNAGALGTMTAHHMDMVANANMRDPAWNEGRRPCLMQIHIKLEKSRRRSDEFV